MKVTEIKNQFPILRKHPELVYLDNAATAQKPQSVIDALTEFYTEENASVHRGTYPLSEQATEKYEAARRTVAKFINAEPEEIIFTSGTTDALNGLAASLVHTRLIGTKPKILLSELEHHSNIVPWQRVEGGNISFLPVDSNYDVGIVKCDSPDVVAVTCMSNVTGTVPNVKAVIDTFSSSSYTVIDTAQAINHMPIDVKALGVDFLAFSGHKAYGPTGIGVLYGKKEHLETMEPFRFGGGMIREVNRKSSTWAPVPAKFEAGTPPIAEAIGLATALDFVSSLGWDKIREHEVSLSKYLTEQLQEIPGLKLYHPKEVEEHGPVFSFTIEGIHPHDLSYLLGEENIATRAGHHCAQILHREVLKVPATTRVSLAIYNTEEDVDKLIAALKKARNKLAKQ